LNLGVNLLSPLLVLGYQRFLVYSEIGFCILDGSMIGFSNLAPLPIEIALWKTD
jgi:hypothetical protein